MTVFPARPREALGRGVGSGTPCLSPRQIERRPRGSDLTLKGRRGAGLTSRESGERLAGTKEKRKLTTRPGDLPQRAARQCQSGRGQDQVPRLGGLLPLAEDAPTPLALERPGPDESRRELPLVCRLRPAQRRNPAAVVKVALALILARRPAALPGRAGRQDQTGGSAPQLRERVPCAVNAFSHIVLCGPRAGPAVLGAALGPALTLRTQGRRGESNSGLFLFLRVRRRVLAGRRRCARARASAAAGHLDNRPGRKFPPPFRALSAAVAEGTEPESRLAALRQKRGLRRRAYCRARSACGLAHPLRNGRPGKEAAALPRARARGVVTGATQLAQGDASAPGAARGAQRFKELPLRLTNRRQLLQHVVDNCQRPVTVEGGGGHSHSTSSWPFVLTPFAQKRSEVLPQEAFLISLTRRFR